MFDSSDARNYGTMNLSAVGRLATPDARLAAQGELSGIMKRFLQENAPNLKLDYVVRSLSDQAGQKVERALLILSGAVLLVLLIATANVASLLVARTSARQRELAVRAALGAGRARIARQLVTEHLVLAAAGTAIGLVIAYWTTQVMLALVPGSIHAPMTSASIGECCRSRRSSPWWREARLAGRDGCGALVRAGCRPARRRPAIRRKRQASLWTPASRRDRGRIVVDAPDRGRAPHAQFHFAAAGAARVRRVKRPHRAPRIPVAGRFNPARDGARWSATLREIRRGCRPLKE